MQPQSSMEEGSILWDWIKTTLLSLSRINEEKRIISSTRDSIRMDHRLMIAAEIQTRPSTLAMKHYCRAEM